MFGLTRKEADDAQTDLIARERAWDKILGLMSDCNVRRDGWTEYDKLKLTLKSLQDGLPGYEDA